MKFCLLLVFAVTYLNASPLATTPGPDWRDKYDHLLMQMINERIAQGERFLEHLVAQLKDWETTKKDDVKQSIIKELDIVLPLVKQADAHVTEELKKTGLDLLETFIINKAKAELDLLIKTFTAVQQEIIKKFGVGQEADPVDWRQEYDRLLFAEINEHIMRADGLLLGLQRQLNEWLKTKSADIKTHIVQEVDFSKPLLQTAIDRTATELKRTDLNFLERFLYEKANDEAKLLLKHYTEIEDVVKKGVEYFAATTAPVIDWRSEYDRLLFEMVEENVRRADFFLLQLVRSLNEYQHSKEQALKERIIREVDLATPLVKSAIDHATKELTRTDLDHIERYLYEKIRDEATILLKYYTAVETEVKK